ncbi:MAG: glycosyltransferase family 39 protein [Acidobacteria bacterium]|nr:glycosyltransferase family 39 protein [Acidobacteriota bacterium]
MRGAFPPAWRALVAPLLAGLAARLALIAWTSPLDLSLDESRFWSLAERGLEEVPFLPPLYPLFLAGVRAVLGDGVLTARLLGACLSLASIVLVHRLAERHLGPGSGTAPAWIAALLPGLAHYDGRIRSESLVILLLLGFAVLWSDPRPAGARRTLVAGSILGIAVLARPEFLLLPVLLAGIGLARRQGVAAIRKGAMLAAGILIVVLPWAARNALHGVPALIGTNGGYNFWKSFNAQTDGSQIPVMDYAVWEGVPEREVGTAGYREGWRYILEHPARSLALGPAKIGHLFGPERDFLSSVKRRQFPRRSLLIDLSFAALENLAWFLLLGGGLFALLGPLRSPVKDLILAVLLNLVLVHLVFFGDDRFHVPLLPFLCVALPEAWDGSLRAGRSVRALGLFLLAEALFWTWILGRDLPRLGALWGA